MLENLYKISAIIAAFASTAAFICAIVWFVISLRIKRNNVILWEQCKKFNSLIPINFSTNWIEDRYAGEDMNISIEDKTGIFFKIDKIHKANKQLKYKVLEYRTFFNALQNLTCIHNINILIRNLKTNSINFIDADNRTFIYHLKCIELDSQEGATFVFKLTNVNQNPAVNDATPIENFCSEFKIKLNIFPDNGTGFSIKKQRSLHTERTFILTKKIKKIDESIICSSVQKDQKLIDSNGYLKVCETFTKQAVTWFKQMNIA